MKGSFSALNVGPWVLGGIIRELLVSDKGSVPGSVSVPRTVILMLSRVRETFITAFILQYYLVHYEKERNVPNELGFILFIEVCNFDVINMSKMKD